MKFITNVITIVCFGSSFVYANLFDNIEGRDRVPQGDSGGGSGGGAAPTPDYAPGQFLVKFKTGASELSRNEAMEASRSVVDEKIVTAAMSYAGDDEGVTLMKTEMAVLEAIQEMLQSEVVEYAEPNHIYTHDATSDDPYVTDGRVWGMCSLTATGGGIANQFGIGATTAWQNDKIDCGDVYVGVIDQGYMFAHADLAANAGTNPGEISGDGLDNDGNGYIDDVNGWDFRNDDSTVYDPVDGDVHGTHVAGIIGAMGGNGIGVAGVCWNVKLMSGKFSGPSGGYTSDAVRAVDYFTDLKNRHSLNIVATSNSWGGGGYSQTLFDAIERANDAGILFVASAGNYGAGNYGSDNDIIPHYPSSYDNDNIIAVASITSTGSLSESSNYGATSVDIGAPGSDIWSTVPVGYGSKSGTSMATPHVTGAAALHKALYPAATAADIKAAILAGATATTSLDGKVLTGGRLNNVGFLSTPPPTTSSPTTGKPTTSPTTSSPTTGKPNTSPPSPSSGNLPNNPTMKPTSKKKPTKKPKIKTAKSTKKTTRNQL